MSQHHMATTTTVEALRALIAEVDALPDTERCLLEHNTRVLIEFARRLVVPLREYAAVLANAVEPEVLAEAIASKLIAQGVRLPERADQDPTRAELRNTRTSQAEQSAAIERH